MTDEWMAPAVERSEPDLVAEERTALEQWLDFHRATLLMKCSGLTAEQLRARPVGASQLSLLGLVRHLTEVERGWFRAYGNAEQLDWPYDPDQDGADFREIAGADAPGNLVAYWEEVAAARAAVAGRSLDDVLPDQRDPDRARNLRWIYLHMIEEYARHNGHADLIRELIDGTTGD